MVSTTHDSFFDSAIKDIERSAWSFQCSAAARCVLRGQGLHDAIVSADDKTRAVQLVLIKNLRSVEEELEAPTADGTHSGFTPLMTALVAGNADIVRLLIAHGSSTAATCAGDLHNSVLHYACATRAIDSLDLILMSVHRHMLIFPNDAGATPLHIASRNGFVDVIEILLRHFASLHEKKMLVRRQMSLSADITVTDELTRDALAAVDCDGKTCGHLLAALPRDDAPYLGCVRLVWSAMSRNKLLNAVDRWGRTMLFYVNSVQVLEIFQTEPSDSIPRDNEQLTPLHFAAGHSCPAALAALGHAFASQMKAPLSELLKLRTLGGETVLFAAARSNRAENMRALILMLQGTSEVVKIDASHILFSRNSAGENVFHVAAQSSAGECLEAIRDYVAAVGICDDVGGMLAVEVLSQRNCMDFSPVLIASTNDADRALQALMSIAISAGSTPMHVVTQSHWVRTKTSALHMSCAAGASKCVEALLAAMEGSSEESIVAVLLEADDDGNSCLMAAIQSGSLRALQSLLTSEGVKVVSPLSQCVWALQHKNKSRQSLVELVEGQCGQRRSASSLPTSPVKLLSTKFTRVIDWEIEPSLAAFAHARVCCCDARKPCIAKAMHSLILGACASTVEMMSTQRCVTADS